jgi:hypothetical protein
MKKMNDTKSRLSRCMAHRALPLAVVTVFGLSGCTQFGAKILPKDRLAYNQAISGSWKEQTLLNIVKIRYLDTPLFLDVASVVSGYTLERSINMSGQLSSSDAIQRDSLGLGASGKLIDRPTITYVPTTGERFAQQLMTPIPPERILFLIQSGWPADMILLITVEALNGYKARSSGGLNAHMGDPNYYRTVELFRELQLSGSVGMRIRESKEMGRTTALIIRKDAINEETVSAGKELGELLGLQPGLDEISVEYGFVRANDTELLIASRSMLQILSQAAMEADVPAVHEKAGICVPTTIREQDIQKNCHVRVSAEDPEDAFVKVYYRDHWFYIADNDLRSKRVFAFMMLLFSVTEGGSNAGLPLVTIPSG